MGATLNTLFEPVQLGELHLTNRIVMAPMTRSRANAEGLPGPLHAAYYGQRGDAGLIVAEGTYPSEVGKGYCRTPGIVTTEQVEAWQRVTAAVRPRGASMVLQLMHVGRVASRYNKPEGTETVAPSAIAAQGSLYSDSHGMVRMEPPRALQAAEIVEVIEQYRRAALNARAAGFDGVELHCSSGYLPMQFLLECSNRRQDDYGGSLQRRLRFTVECLEAMAGAIGAARVSLRICPGNPYNDMQDDDPVATYSALLDAVDPLGLAYVHVSRSPLPGLDAFALARRHFSGALILNDGFDGCSAAKALNDGLGEAVSFARHFIANPDLVVRLRKQAALAGFDRTTLYTPGAPGYCDYPPLAAACPQERQP
jgi:N-ethylmaleimide reductase